MTLQDDLQRMLLDATALEDYFTVQDLAAMFRPNVQWKTLSQKERRQLSIMYQAFVESDRARRREIEESIKLFCQDEQKSVRDEHAQSQPDPTYERAASIIVDSLHTRADSFDRNSDQLLNKMQEIADAVGRIDATVSEFNREQYSSARDSLDKLLSNFNGP